MPPLECQNSSLSLYRFRVKTSYMPIGFFIRLKLQKTGELLETTEVKVSQISQGLVTKTLRIHGAEALPSARSPAT